jgi:hypothetical protein
MVVLVALVAATDRRTAERALPYLFVGALALAGGVVIDARRIRLRDYETSLAWHPALVFVLVALSPLVVFPWYLTVRERVLQGQAPRRRPAAER